MWYHTTLANERQMMGTDNMTLAQMAKRYMDLRQGLDAQRQIASRLQKEFDQLRFTLIPDKMDEEGYETLRIADVGTVVLTDDIRVSLVPEDKNDAYQWVVMQGHDEIVQDYIHPSTLKAFIKEQMASGTDLPDDVFKIEPFVRASVRKG